MTSSPQNIPGPPERRGRLDRIAREAARLLETRRAENIGQALRLAADALGEAGGPMPGHGRVRKHAQAMNMQALGDAGYEAYREHVWRVAEQIMATLEETMPGVSAVLVGRAARGQIDAGVRLHIRLYTTLALAELAAALVAHGYEEPGFDTIQTAYGPLNRILLADEGLEIALTRCPPAVNVPRDRDVQSGRTRLATATATDLRRWLDE